MYEWGGSTWDQLTWLWESNADVTVYTKNMFFFILVFFLFELSNPEVFEYYGKF